MSACRIQSGWETSVSSEPLAIKETHLDCDEKCNSLFRL